MTRILFLAVLTFVLGRHASAQFSVALQQPACYGACNGSAHIIDSTGQYHHYAWSTGDTFSTISNLCAGTYQCTIRNSNGTNIDTIVAGIQQPALLTINTSVLKHVKCYGDTSASILFNTSGGTGTRYNFIWSNGLHGFLSNGDTFPLSAGNYSITITDAHACSASSGFIITQPSPITLSGQINNTTSCGTCNGSIILTASGGNSNTYSFHWATGATTQSLVNLCNGGYYTTVTDSAGCSVNATYNVLADTNLLGISFSTVTNIDCSHPTGTLFAQRSGGTAPYHFLWSTGSTLPDIFSLQAGIYSVSITDSLGCFATATDTIQNLGLQISSAHITDFRCDNNKGSIRITVSQGTAPYTLRWSGGATTDTLDGLLPGTYTVTVSDHGGCTITPTFTVAQVNTSLNVQVSKTDVSCQNINNGVAIANVSGGLAPFNYLWNTTSYQTTDTAIGISAGAYHVRVIDAYGCSVQVNVNIGLNDTAGISTTSYIANCDSGGIAIAHVATGTGPYTYLWSTNPTQSSDTAFNVPAGNYTVSVTDAGGCTRVSNGQIQFSCVGLVTGTVFYDANANCIKNNGEQGVPGVPVLVTNHNITFEGVTNLNGQYSIPITQAGGYRILTGVNASSTILQYGNSTCGYLEACPASDTITFVTLNDTFRNYNFGFVGTPDFDLAVNAGWGATNASLVKEYWVLYANEAFITPYNGQATVTFNYDPNLTFQSGIPAPVNNTNTHTLTWVVDSLPSPVFTWAKRLRAFFSVPLNLPADYLYKNDFHIAPYSGDCDTANNSIYTQQIAGLPATSVSKDVYPVGNLNLSDTVLTYTIHFQNTGTDTAGIIRVTDSLSPYLDPLSVQNIACSQLFDQYYIAPGAILTWIFNPANLPPASTNALTSAGFISFTAKLKSGTQPGYFINNTATVLLNNNPAVATNTTTNFISFPTSIQQIAGSNISVKVFPNPFSDVTNFEVEGINERYDFELTDITGRVVKTLNAQGSGKFSLSRERLSKGVYFYRFLIDNQQVANGKLVID